MLLADLFQSTCKLEDIREVLAGVPVQIISQRAAAQQVNVPWNFASEVTLVKIVRRFVLASEETPPKRRIRDYSDAELSGSSEDSNFLIFDIESERRVLDLKRGYWVHGVCATKGCSRALGQAQIFYFACSELRRHQPERRDTTQSTPVLT